MKHEGVEIQPDRDRDVLRMEPCSQESKWEGRLLVRTVSWRRTKKLVRYENVFFFRSKRLHFL